MSIFVRVRKKINLSQVRMAEKLGMSRQTWQMMEYGELLPSREMADRIYDLTAEVVPSLADCLGSNEARSWTKLRPYEFHQSTRENWARVHDYCENMTEIYRKIPASLLGWMENMLACECIPEGFTWLQFGLRGARRLIASPHQLGFRSLPIVDTQGQFLGDRVLPGLQGTVGEVSYLLWPQVGVRPRSATFRLDGLVLLKHSARIYWADLEIDSALHDPERDRLRSKLVGLPEIRLIHEDVEAVRVVDRFQEQALSFFGKAA